MSPGRVIPCRLTSMSERRPSALNGVLRRDGRSNGCGATGNCQLWIFRKAGGKWLSMFGSDQAPIAEGFQLGPARSQGVKDLAIAANSSAEASQRVTYKFDGKQYRAK